MYMLNALGFNILNDDDYDEKALEIVNKNADNRYGISAPLSQYIVKEIDDIELWFGYVKDKGVTGVFPHYRSRTFIELTNLEWTYLNSYHDYGYLQGEYEDYFPLELEVADAGFIEELDPNKTYKCQLTFYSVGADLYDSLDEYHEACPDIADEAVILSGSFRENKLEPPTALITGYIRELEIKENSYTNNKYYLIAVETFGGIFDCVASLDSFNREPKVGDILSGTFIPEGRIMDVYYNFEASYGFPVKNRLIEGVETLEDLYDLMSKSYSIETTYPGSREWFSMADRTIGNCGVASVLVHDMFGGEIRVMDLGESGTHYFNKINDIYVDLTSEQFDLYHNILDYDDSKVVTRESFNTEAFNKRLERLIDNINLLRDENTVDVIN